MLHQNRLKFHTATVPNTPALQTWTYKGMRKADADPILLGRAGVSQALWDFLSMVQNIIPHDKYKTFCSLFRFPVHTNEITGVVTRACEAVCPKCETIANIARLNREFIKAKLAD